MSSSVGCALIDACHAFGWPVARGGSRSITDALASVLQESGGTIETGHRVSSVAELGSADVVVFDLAPGAVAEIAGDRLPARVARAYRRYRHGPGAFKLDLAVEGGVPWVNEACRRAGTVHVAGTFEEIAIAERAINRGSMPERPFMLVGQQYLADPGRSKDELHPVWVYAHVPSAYQGDATENVLGQIERFAPGFRERIVATSVRAPADLAAYRVKFEDPDRLRDTLIIELDGVVIGDLMCRIEDGWAQAEVAEQARRVQAELGWCIHPECAGKGYATEAVAELIRFCFEDLNLRRVTANCFAGNEASWRLMERLRMRRELHTVKESLHRSGEWLDGLGYALLAEEWRKGR